MKLNHLPSEKRIEETYSKWKSGEITAVMFMEMLDLRKNTFYKIMKEYDEAK
ncbi:integrase [Bacillus cereus]|nr:integrase [Bacillus cereus]